MVDPTTRTVPLLAETANPDGLLKLGMFVRIVLDSADHRAAPLTVPTAAVVEIEGQKVVFVPAGKDERTFTVRPVKLGREAGDRLVILAGLARGRPVVSSGAFFLKSELILQNETEEDIESPCSTRSSTSSLAATGSSCSSATLLVAGLGVYSALNLPIDAVPDLTNVQVQVITEAPALARWRSRRCSRSRSRGR